MTGVVDNGDGTKTWTIVLQKEFGKSYTYDVAAKLNTVWSDPIAVSFEIAAAPVEEKLISAEATPNNDGTVTITVVTVKDASKVKLTKDDGSTITIQRGNKLSSEVDDETAGTTTWTITLTKAAGKLYKYTVTTNVGGVYFGDKTIEFTIPVAE